MEDDQTGSLWSQISGECIQGELLGMKLELYPAQFSTYGAQKETPKVQFLVKPEKGPENSVYKDYFEDRGRMGIFGTMYKDSLMDGKDVVYGLRIPDRQIALPKLLFVEQSAYQVTLDTLSLLVISGENDIIAAYVLPASEKEWKLASEGSTVIVSPLKDRPMVATFSDGIQTQGEPLESYPVITSFWFAWKAFFPTSDILEP
jgi:hypothetical protein